MDEKDEIHGKESLLALENWERWTRRRKAQSEKLAATTGRPARCVLMNRDEGWAIKRERNIISEASQINTLTCRCGGSGCPMFWTTVEAERPGGKRNVKTETFPSPLLLQHKGKKLSHLQEAAYIGHPKEILRERGLEGPPCQQSSLERFLSSKLVKNKKHHLKKEIEEVKGFIPDVDNLIVIGESVFKPVIEQKFIIPELIYTQWEDRDNWIDETEPILEVGTSVLKGRDKKGADWLVEFLQNRIPSSNGRFINFTNKGSIAIKYKWSKEQSYENAEIPLKTKNILTRFFFNKGEGTLLPGQTWQHIFWFRSRSSGVYRESWVLHTVPELPKMRFLLEGISTKNDESEMEEFMAVNRYLDKCVAESAGQEMFNRTFMSGRYLGTGGSDVGANFDYASNFLEKDIFEHINPLLYYDIDAVTSVKKLYSRFFMDDWDLSMDDLCMKLMERMTNEDEQTAFAVFREYSTLFKRLQKKPVFRDLQEADWERLKYDMCYLYLCTAVGKMERSMRYKNWSLRPPPKPPGPASIYKGIMLEKRKKKRRPPSGKDEVLTSDEEMTIRRNSRRDGGRTTTIGGEGGDKPGGETLSFDFGLKVEFDGPQRAINALRNLDMRLVGELKKKVEDRLRTQAKSSMARERLA